MIVYLYVPEKKPPQKILKSAKKVEVLLFLAVANVQCRVFLTDLTCVAEYLCYINKLNSFLFSQNSSSVPLDEHQ